MQYLIKTHSCEAPHYQHPVSGIHHIVLDHGTELDCKLGDVSPLPSGYDAWTVENELVVVDFQALINFAWHL